MMPDNTLWTFLSLLAGGGALEIAGAWLLHVSRVRLGGRVLFIGAIVALGGIILGLSTV